MSYTPNTWATGDTITAAKLNNIEQGIANAGMPTAQVSISITNQDAGIGFMGTYWDEQLNNNMVRGLAWIGTALAYEVWYEQPMSTVLEVMMLDDYFSMRTYGSSNVTVTGNATAEYYESEGNYEIQVTGDCTITVA